MAVSLAFYNDPGLTSPLTSLSVAQASDGNSPAVDRVVYVGSTVAGKKFQVAANPGVDPVIVSPSDSATGSGVQTSHIKLALSQAGLNTATAGAGVSLGTQVLSGAANSVAVYVRVDTPALAVGTYTDVSLVTPTLIEVTA